MNSIYLVSLTQLISELHDVAQRVTKKLFFLLKFWVIRDFYWENGKDDRVSCDFTGPDGA